MHLRRKAILHNQCPRYNTKTSYGEVPVLELWEMWSTHSLLLFPGSLWPGVEVFIRASSMGQMQIFDIF